VPAIKAISLAVSTTRARRGRVRAAFSLADLLVSVFIIIVLIGVLLPTLSGVREMSRRVVCQSNIRQVGLAITMYADENRGMLPLSRFTEPAGAASGAARGRVRSGQVHAAPQDAMVVRPLVTAAGTNVGTGWSQWDGIGWLYAMEYLSSPAVFYCPSHRGNHPMARYASLWSDSSLGAVVANYHYRGAEGTSNLYMMNPRTALVADGMRTQADYNHRVGTNVLRADISVEWFSDPAGLLGQLLPLNEGEIGAADKVITAWDTLDSGGSGATPPGNSGPGGDGN
jgi:type II secretory pathway pseudopilin PulG